MVRIYVGPEKKLWVVPEAILCDRVEFFRSAFQSGFRESKDKVLELPEDDPTAFGYILDKIFHLDYANTIHEFGNTIEARQAMWFKVHILADKLRCSDFLHLEDLFYYDEFYMQRPGSDQRTLFVSPAGAKFLYENTADSDKMRGAISDRLAFRHLVKPPMDDTELTEWTASVASHPKLHIDVMIKLRDHMNLTAEQCRQTLWKCAVHDICTHPS